VPVRKKRIRLAGFVLGLSALLLVLVAAGLVHEHHSAASEATCVVCHLGRAPLAHAAAGAALPLPVVLSSASLDQRALPRLEAVFLQSPSRAPPALLFS
jgi:hypothetical protein